MSKGYFSIIGADGVKKCLDDLSEASLSSITECHLAIHDLTITPPVLALFLKVLNFPLQHVKWQKAFFCRCKIADEITSCVDDSDEGRCPCDDLHLFASLLASRIRCLELRKSLAILKCLRHAPKLGIEYIFIEKSLFSISEVKAFVDFVQRNDALKGFLVDNTYINRCCDGVVNGFHLRNIMSLSDDEVGELELTDTLIDRDHLGGLLQNSQTKLQELSLNRVHLEDRHLIAIAQMLPTSHLEVLDVSDNRIRYQGIMAFAQEMPRMKSLKEVHLEWNPWEDAPSKEFDKCCAALLQGLRQNHSITYLKPRRSSPLVDRLEYYGCLNWAGYRIITAPNTFPVGLWPHVLIRIWNSKKYRSYPADVIYFLLRNSTLFTNSCQTRNPEEGTKKN